MNETNSVYLDCCVIIFKNITVKYILFTYIFKCIHITNSKIKTIITYELFCIEITFSIESKNYFCMCKVTKNSTSHVNSKFV